MERNRVSRKIARTRPGCFAISLVLALAAPGCSDSAPRNSASQIPETAALVGRFVDEFPRVGAFRKPANEGAKLALQTRHIADRDYVLLTELEVGTEISHDKILGALAIPKTDKSATAITFDCRTGKPGSTKNELLVALIDQSTVQQSYRPLQVWSVDLTNYQFRVVSADNVECQLVNYATQPPPTEKPFPENFRW